MSEWLIVLLKIAGMFLVMLVGWLARRRRFLSAEHGVMLSQVVVDLALPALVLHQMVTAIDGGALRDGWFIPILAVVTVVAAQLVGWLLAPLFTHRGPERSTFIFLIAISNWIYLPLPLAATLFGARGTLVVLLYNIGGLVMLWTLGVWTLRGASGGTRALRELATNPGLLATAGGILLALALPKGLANSQSLAGYITHTAEDALGLVGSLTIPLSLLLIGLQLAGLPVGTKVGLRPLAGVLVGRLLLAPALLVLFVVGVGRLGFTLDNAARLTSYLIAGMPVAVNCGVFAERFGGDVPLASRGIFYTTLLSILTLPLLLYVVETLHL